MNERRSVHRTQWAAQFAVASELCKLNYQVALTLGNHPIIDLMVVTQSGKQFSIDVKGLYKPNYWQVKKQKPRAGLFYVFAYVPDAKANRYFVMTQETVNRLIDDHRKQCPPSENYREGIPRSLAEKYENRWDLLPDYEPPPQSK